MTQEAQRIAIAAACGWMRSSDDAWTDEPLNYDKPSTPLPDYLNSLDAMHEAEKVLFEDEIKWAKYRDELFKFYYVNDTFSPTAAQRADAFLRTIGKWEEDK